MRSLFLLACVVGGAQSAPVLATPPVTGNSSGVTCDLCTGVIGYAIGNSCDSALCSAVGFLGPQAATVCEVLESAASVLGLSLCDYIENRRPPRAATWISLWHAILRPTIESGKEIRP